MTKFLLWKSVFVLFCFPVPTRLEYNRKDTLILIITTIRNGHNIYLKKYKLQNHGLIYGSIHYNVSSYSFANQTTYLTKQKRNIDSISIYLFEETCVKFRREKSTTMKF